MKKMLLVAGALSASLAAAPAFADMYVGAGLGKSDTDSSERSWKMYVGKQFTQTWGLEVGYTDLGQLRNENVNAWSLAGTATVPFGGNWSMFGKLGVSRNKASYPGATTRTSTLYGIGGSYALSQNMGLRLEYEDFGRLSDAADDKASAVTLSLKYSF